ncbi:MAG: LysR family transcriptional regulator [Pseudomonadota bacterium]
MNGSPFSLPPLEWVRAFEAAARLGSFTAAAAETGLTQPAVSHRIAQLEKHLNARLFFRRPRAITLTVEGETWLPYVQTALRDLSDSSEMLFAKGRQQLTISASQSVISMWLAPRLSSTMLATGAAISVQSLVLGGQSATQDETIQIRYGPGRWPHFYQVPLFKEAIAPVCAPSLAGEDWAKLPRIACTGPRPDWKDCVKPLGVPSNPNPQIRVDTLHAAVAIAKAGHGVALGSLPLCSDGIHTGSLVRLGGCVVEHTETYWILASRDAIGPRQWEALVGTLKGQTDQHDI